MTRVKLVILDGFTLNPGDLSWEPLRELAEVEVYDRTAPDEVIQRAVGAALVLTNKTPVSGASIERLSDLRYVGVTATGYDVVNTAEAARRGIVVTNVPTYGTASVAQFVFALLLELCHRVQDHADAARAGEWARSPDWCLRRHPLIELAGKKLGIIGLGRIGRQVARLGDAFGMEIVAYDAFPGEPPDCGRFRWAQIDEVLKESDVVTLHCPLTAETKRLIDARRLALMRPTAILINTARGALVDEQDLADALNAGRLAGAALDVLSVEPPANGNPLFSARGCIVTPHIAWATREARERLLHTVIENVRAFLGGSPVNVVS